MWTLVIFTQFYSNAFPNTRQDKVLINNHGLVNLGHETLVLSLDVQRWNVWFWNRLKMMCDCVKCSVCRVRSQVFLSSHCAAMISSRFSTKVCLYFLYFVLYRKDRTLFVCLFCCHAWPAATLRLRFLLEFLQFLSTLLILVFWFTVSVLIFLTPHANRSSGQSVCLFTQSGWKCVRR